MASRQTANSASSSGFQYAAGQAGSAQLDIQETNTVQCVSTALPVAQNFNSALANAIVGTTINGQVVGPIEVWADGAVWDTTNSRFLRPNIDYDVTLLYRSGKG